MWIKTITLKHLFTEDEDYESLQASMNCIADVLKIHPEFQDLDFSKFHNLPRNDEWCTPLEAANKLLNAVYDIADVNKIWIE